MKIRDLVPRSQFEHMQKIATQQKNIINKQRSEINYMQATLIKAKGILNFTVTEKNLKNAVNMLESLPDKEKMQRFVNKRVLKSAKTPNSCCRIIKEKCEKVNRFYGGFNSEHYTFNHLPYNFVYEAFKERAIRKNPTSFSFRFRDALVAFILSQQKGTSQKGTSKDRQKDR